MASVFFYAIGIGFTLGVFVHSLTPIPLEAMLLCMLVGFVLTVLGKRSGGAAVHYMLGAFLIALALGGLRLDATSWQESTLSMYEGSDVELVGVVVREPDVRVSTQHLYIREKVSEELLLVTTDAFLPVQYGDTITVSGALARPESFETDLGRTFNYEGYLRARGVSLMVQFAEVEVTDHGGGNIVLRHLFLLKHRFMDALEFALPEPQAGLAEGLLLGVKRALGEDLEEAFRKVGIIHIVVLSGFNIMIVADAMMRVLSLFLSRRARLIAGLTAVTLFALMVGLSATVVRASIMASLVLIARAFGRTSAILRALTLAGLVMLLVNPYILVFDPGFQLSFLATLGLIFIAPWLDTKLVRVPSFFQIREYLTATLATQLMVLPLLLYMIGQFSVLSVLVNVLVLPLVPVAMLLAFIVGVVGTLLPQLVAFVGFMANLSLLYIVGAATFFGALPFAAFTVPAFPFWLVVISYAAIALFIWFTERGRKEVHEELVLDESEFADWTIVEYAEFVRTQNAARGADAPRAALPFR